jgi:hypothetical protein
MAITFCYVEDVPVQKSEFFIILAKYGLGGNRVIRVLHQHHGPNAMSQYVKWENHEYIFRLFEHRSSSYNRRQTSAESTPFVSSVVAFILAVFLAV